jgi:lauroyl/myristoyl acyltransferase
MELIGNAALGGLAWRHQSGRRREITQRMEEALGPHPDLDQLVRQCFETHFMNQYVGFSFNKITADTWPSYLCFRGFGHLDRALERGEGVVMAHPHMGLPQLPLHVLGLRGYDVRQVGGGRPTVLLSRTGKWAAAQRSRLEERISATLHDGKDYLRPVLRGLQDNGVVFTACDGTGGGEEWGRRQAITVLDRQMALPVFPAWLSVKTGATLLPVVTWKNDGETPFVVEIGEPIEAAGVDERVALLGACLQRWIRLHPGDWHFWDQWHCGPGGLLVKT